MATNDRDQSSSAAEASFERLLVAVRNHDRVALNELIAPMREYLMLIANEDLDSALQAKLGASDLVQQTMAVACERIGQFRGSTPMEMKGWLRQILHNCLHDAERQFLLGIQRNVHRERPWTGVPPASQAIVDYAETPRTDAIRREEESQLATAMSLLPESYRQAIQLRHWEELSFPEIGARMGLTAEAARKTWFRGITKLESLLKHPDD